MFKNEWEKDGPMCTNKQVRLIHRFSLSRVVLLWTGDAGLMSVTKLV